ncbi:hypothetical protein Tco_1201365 [Tanacetum coccineum]
MINRSYQEQDQTGTHSQQAYGQCSHKEGSQPGKWVNLEVRIQVITGGHIPELANGVVIHPVGPLILLAHPKPQASSLAAPSLAASSTSKHLHEPKCGGTTTRSYSKVHHNFHSNQMTLFEDVAVALGLLAGILIIFVKSKIPSDPLSQTCLHKSHLCPS